MEKGVDGQDKAPRDVAPSLLRKFSPVLLTVLLGTLLSMWAFGIVRNWEKQKFRFDFERAAVNRLSAIRRDLESGAHIVESLGAFYAASWEVERKEFKEFSQPLLMNHPGIQALEWIPRVPDSHRWMYEDAARKQKFPFFHITERKAPGEMIKAGERDEYFPVYYVEPYKGNEPALGFDLASDRTRRESLYRSRDTGKMVASAPVKLVQETGNKSGFLLLLPVYAKGLPTESIENRRKNLEGFVLGAFRVGDIVEKALTYLEPQGIDIYIFDESAPEGEGFLYFHPSRIRKTPIGPAARILDDLRTDPHYAAMLNLPERNWVVLFKPTPAYAAAQTTLQPIGVLLFGLIFTGTIAAYFLINIARATELATANNQLQQEIDERKKVEEKLRFTQFSVDRAADAAFWMGPDARFIYVNNAACRSLGYTREELLSMTVHDIDPDFPAEAWPDHWKDVKERGSFKVESRHRAKDGRVFPVEITVNFIEFEGKEYNCAFAHDVTERKQREEKQQKLEVQLRHTQKLESLGVLAGGIAHDFNNLLTGILGNAGLALMKLPPASPGRRFLEEIETASERAAELCSQMLAYSGKGRFIVEAISLNEIVQEMIHLLKVSISKKATLKFNLADNLPAIEVDITQIRQVIMNLVTNASEAIDDKNGLISISTGSMECDRAYLSKTYLEEQFQEGVYVYLEVSDSGCGMDKETVGKIFDPFFSTKFTGRGLGLAAVLGIVRGHKGAMKVYSEVGKGTTFKILLPALEQAAGTVKKESAQIEKPWQGTGIVLLVDDEETVQKVGRSILETAGFTVLMATDGREAVEIFRERQDEIVLTILDMTMPQMGGEEAFREIRQIKADARVILSSGYNEQEITNRFTGKGLAGFVQKPYQYQAMIEKVRIALEG